VTFLPETIPKWSIYPSLTYNARKKTCKYHCMTSNPSRATIPPPYHQPTLPHIHSLFATNSLSCLALLYIYFLSMCLTTVRQTEFWFLFISYIPRVYSLVCVSFSHPFFFPFLDFFYLALWQLAICKTGGGESSNLGPLELFFFGSFTIIYCKYGSGNSWAFPIPTYARKRDY
jgi:hypothetical protein